MNVLENIPYNESRMGNRKVVDEKHLLIMQLALKQGQVVPQHNANSNVHILVLKGKITVDLNGKQNHLKEGDLLRVEYQTPMSIKTPNPSEIDRI